MVQIEFKLLSPDAQIPQTQSELAAGFDLCSSEEKNLQPYQIAAVGCGFAMALPPDYEGQVRPRSGLALKHGVTVLNSPGTIDADYRGEIKVILINHGSQTFRIEKGDRIAQLVVNKLTTNIDLVKVSELPDSQRGVNGFGSTGTK